MSAMRYWARRFTDQASPCMVVRQTNGIAETDWFDTVTGEWVRDHTVGAEVYWHPEEFDSLEADEVDAAIEQMRVSTTSRATA